MMSEQPLEPTKDPQLKEQLETPSLMSPSTSTAVAKEHVETEWIPGEQLELIRIPPPTIWPATVALGITGMAFGVVTQWILSAAGLFLFLLGAVGWIEDLKKDV